MGWEEANDAPYIVRAYQTQDASTGEADEDDIVICCERDLALIERRLSRGKLCFYMSERWFKPPLGFMRVLNPSFTLMAWRFRILSANPLFRFLAIGHYAARDMACIAKFGDRTSLWGYCTAEVKSGDLRKEPAAIPTILFAGRMLKWKRVDTLIRAFSTMVSQGKVAKLLLIGDGPERLHLEQLVRRSGSTALVEFRPSSPMAAVWEEMKNSDIFVLPSDGGEGWGAVVNEAMSAGCAVIACRAGGAAKTLISHGENGFLFQSGDWADLARMLSQLLADHQLRTRIAQAGQKTVTELWSAKVSAERFVGACESLLAGHSMPSFSTGPLSRAR